MNYQLILSVLVVSSVFANPTAEIKADWPVARTTLAEFMETIASAINTIKVTSMNDNADIGAIVERKTEVAMINVNVIIGNLMQGVMEEYLTEPMARSFMGSLNQLLTTLQDDLQVDVDALSLAAQNTIRQTFALTRGRCVELAEMLYTALNA